VETHPGPRWHVTAERPDSPDALALWAEYYTEMSDRWYQLHEGRLTDPAELAREIAAEDGHCLVPPTGSLLIARHGGALSGCAGVRMLDPETAELKRVYLRPVFRGTGGGPILLGAAEDAARALGAGRIVLDTRGDLVEARRLYARNGYQETAAYNDQQYAEHWFAKDLGR
jgi:GNAT superfamily N-acetyltransferase